MIETRRYVKEDYPTLTKWWEGHGEMVEPEGWLPRIGLVATMNSNPVAVCFLYETGTPIGYIHHILADPNEAKTITAAGVEAALESTIEAARHMGMEALIGFTTRPGVVKMTKRHGFNKEDGAIMARSII